MGGLFTAMMIARLLLVAWACWICGAQDHDGSFLAELQAQANVEKENVEKEQASLDSGDWYGGLIGSLSSKPGGRNKARSSDVLKSLESIGDELGESNDCAGLQCCSGSQCKKTDQQAVAGACSPAS